LEKSPGRFSLLGVALRNLGKDLEAEEAYRSAIRLDPAYEEAHFNLGVLFRKDRPSEAQALFRAALELDPDYGAAHRELGHVLSKLGFTAEAEEHLRRSIELQPKDAWAHIYLGTHIWASDPDSAIKEYHEASEMCSEWTVPLWSLGNIHEFALKDYDRAQSFFESALRLDPDDVVTLMNIGRLCKKRAAFTQARQYLDRALLLDPANQEVRGLLAEIAAERSD
jgi:superkiller protein 3